MEIANIAAMPTMDDAYAEQRAAASQRLENHCESHGMSELGSRWYIHYTDPFRDDGSVEPAGYPDSDRCNSVLADITTEVTIAVPATGGPYDVHVATSGILGVAGASDLSITNELRSVAINTSTEPYVVQNVPVEYAKWPAQAVLFSIVPAGEPTFPGDVNVGLPDAEHVYGGLNVLGPAGASYLESSAIRLVGFGLETLNVTPVLQKGGQCLSYRQAGVATQDQTIYSNGATTVGPTLVDNSYGTSVSVELPGPPTTAGAARLLHDTTEVGTEVGSYQVGCITTIDHPFSSAKAVPAVIDVQDANYAIVSAVGFTDAMLSGRGYNNEPVGYKAAVLASPSIDAPIYTNFDQMGTMHLGVPAGTSIMCRARVKVEIATNASQGLLATLAKRSSSYDPVALATAARVLAAAPTSVPFKANAAGEWLDKVAGLTKWAAPVLSTVFPQAAPLIAGGAALIGKIQKRNAAKRLEVSKFDKDKAAKYQAQQDAAEAKARAKLAQLGLATVGKLKKKAKGTRK